MYDPSSYLTDPSLLQPLETASWIERCAFSELLAGNMRKHVFYAVKKQNPVRPPGPENLLAVPMLRDWDGKTFAEGFKPGSSITVTNDGVAIRLPLPRLAGAIVQRIDNQRTVETIYAEIWQMNRELDQPAFLDQFTALFAALSSVGKMYLRLPN